MVEPISVESNKMEKMYQKKNVFGAPYPQFVAFVKKHIKGQKVLDIGCGQGRDSLFLAEEGNNVTAIDPSSRGIADLRASAKEKGLQLTTVVADALTYKIDSEYDLILLDMVLHHIQVTKEEKNTFLKQLVKHINAHGRIIIVEHTREETIEVSRTIRAEHHNLNIESEGEVIQNRRWIQKLIPFLSFRFYMVILKNNNLLD